MNRRGFMAAILAAGVAPMVVKAGVLMPVRSVIVPTYYDHIAPYPVTLTLDDTAYVQACLDRGGLYLPRGVYRVSKTLRITKDSTIVDGSVFEFSGLEPGQSLIHAGNVDGCVITNCHFKDTASLPGVGISSEFRS